MGAVKKSVPFFNAHAHILFTVSLVINLAVLMFVHNKHLEFYFAAPLYHDEVAYNFYSENELKIKRARMNDVSGLYGRGLLPNYRAIDHAKYQDEPLEHRPMIDSVGFGVLIGLLWKLTGSLSFLDVQIVQILVFSFLFFLLYQISFTVFRSRSVAFLGCLLTLFLYLPLVLQNVQVQRDIWAYYATVALLYGVLRVIEKRGSIVVLTCSALFATFCQWIRPTCFTTVVLFLVVLFFGTVARAFAASKAFPIIAVITVVNGLLFWIPFFAYNKWAYDRWFVFPLGQGLVEGIGERKNKHGFKVNDGWFKDCIEKRCGAKYGTPECDEDARILFWETFRSSPATYFRGVLVRFVDALFPVFKVYLVKVPAFEGTWVSFRERWQFFMANLTTQKLLHVIINRFFSFLLLVVGYLGIFLAIGRLSLSRIIFLISVIASGWPFTLTHIETRHLIPFYWPFALFGGYFLIRAVPQIRGLFKRLSLTEN